MCRNNPIYSDTVSRVGVFCSAVNAIEMCKTEGVVDVFQVVKALRIQKPGAVQTVVGSLFIAQYIPICVKPFMLSLQNQYISIFDMILTFSDSP